MCLENNKGGAGWWRRDERREGSKQPLKNETEGLIVLYSRIREEEAKKPDRRGGRCYSEEI